MTRGGSDTSTTRDDEFVEALRRQGVLGPFVVTDWAAATDTGLVRKVNEDRWMADPALGFVLADGMGGHAGGEVAAELTVATTFAMLDQLAESTARIVVAHANRAVTDYGDRNALPKLGSTLCALAARRTHVVIVNVGDSRVYRWRTGEIEMLTTDHSVRAELMTAGVPLEEANRSHVRLDALTSFIGRRPELVPPFRVASFSVVNDDRFLLCSDGVHRQLTLDQIQSALGATSCRISVDRLIEGARAAGGFDNATAVVAKFEFEADPT